MGAMRALPLLALSLVACGRTEPVRFPYVIDTSDQDGRTHADDGGIACIDGALALEPAHPVVTLVVDRSSSMGQRFTDSGASKWNSLKAALRTSLPPWNEAFELGLHLFPSKGVTQGCTDSGGFTLAPALANVDAVIEQLNQVAPGGATPTAVAIENAGAALSTLRTASSAKGLILATDGAPDCNEALPRGCVCTSGSTCSGTRCLDDARTIERISTVAASGIPTWVIGIRSSDDAVFFDVLNRMAVAGGRPQEGAQRFFSATSEAELEAAFTSIGQQVGECHYLTASVPDVGGSIALELDGAFVPYDVAAREGWAWVDAGNGEIALFGNACARAKALGVEKLSVVVQCAN